MDERPSSRVATSANANGPLTMAKSVDEVRLNAADLRGKIAAIAIE
jgi:hypothetical protein